MKTKTPLILVTAICLVAGWAIRPSVIAQNPSVNPTLPKPSADSSKPTTGEKSVPDLPNPEDDELRALILLLTEKSKPSANEMPNRMQNVFVEHEKLILKLASEVLLLRERVEKLEHKAKTPETPTPR
jgi:hypothetical protein